jgi:MFS transporter, DHA3 family, macrolide efflux protein
MTQTEETLPGQAVRLVVTRGISGLGSSLTAFGLDVWVFQRTGSYEIFAYLAILAMLPNLLLAPFAGMLVDRCDKRKLLMACEYIPLAALLWAFWQLQQDALDVMGVAFTVLALSLAGAVRWNVMGVAISVLAPSAVRGRLNALQQAFMGVSMMLGPALGAGGLAMFGLKGLLIIDAATCLIAGIALLTIRHQGLNKPSTSPAEFGGFWREVTFGVRWVFRHPGLRRLLVFFMAFNLGVSVFSVVFTPYVLTFASSQVLGWGLALQGSGAFLLGLALSRRSSKHRPEVNVLMGALMYGALMVVWGVSKHTVVVLALAFMAGALTTLIMSSSQTIWQANVPVEVQGKVFSARMMLSFSTGPIAILASVPVSEHVFAPMLARLPLASELWGSAPGGAIAMMVSALGLAIVLGCVALLARGGLRVSSTSPERSLSEGQPLTP